MEIICYYEFAFFFFFLSVLNQIYLNLKKKSVNVATAMILKTKRI